METIELEDIQRLVIRSYRERVAAYYALLEVVDPPAARSWLGGLLGWIGSADPKSRREDPPKGRPERRVNVAFTWEGLKKLGIQERDCETAGFVGEFLEGMVTPHRSLVLGDRGASDPSQWRWGRRYDPIHILLLVYSRSHEALPDDWSEIERGLEGVALWAPENREAFENPILAYLTDDQTEHFGFRDGISQPYIAGSDTRMRPSGRHAAGATVAPGEFVLGYRNEMGRLPASPKVPNEADPGGILPEHPEDPARSRDFGRNGTYLVLRQLEQDVKKFREFVKSRANGREELLGAKLVGRWKSGAPLVKAPDGDDPRLHSDNDFGFHAEDPYGFRCPVGSHIRRANPRDALADPSLNISPAEAQALVNRHRLIRRGRLYGERGEHAAGERGLLFLCLNANLQRQFEFVQQHWIRGPKFAGLDDEVDPLVAVQPGESGRMTIQERPLSTCIEGIPSFVRMRGGAYFFLPGLKALRFLARLRPPDWPKPPATEPELPRFRPRRLLAHPDLQTLANLGSTLIGSPPHLSRLEAFSRRLAFPMRDGTGDALLGSLHEPRRKRHGSPLVLVIHGLPGSEDSAVVLRTAAHFLGRGHRVLRLNQRGAGPSQGRTREIYHAGRSGDLQRVVEQLHGRFPNTEIVIIAYSLGANVMLKMLGEGPPGPRVRAAVSVSAPIDLGATAVHLNGLRGLRRLMYVRALLAMTKRCVREIPTLDARQRAAIEAARSFYAFDEEFLAPLNGFDGAQDYYRRSSSAALLPSISIPTLLIHAEDDPFVPFTPYREVDWRANDELHPMFAASGGHAGFHQREDPVAWHDRCAEIFFDG